MNYLLSVNAFDKRNHKISVQYNAGRVIHVGGKRSSCYEVYFMCKSVSVRVHLTSYQIQYICFLWVKLFLRLLYLKNYIFGRSLCVCVHVGGGGGITTFKSSN